jgi:hypothetical protein
LKLHRFFHNKIDEVNLYRFFRLFRSVFDSLYSTSNAPLTGLRYPPGADVPTNCPLEKQYRLFRTKDRKVYTSISGNTAQQRPAGRYPCLDMFVDVRSACLWCVSYISFICYVHSDFNTHFTYYYNIHISYDNFRNFDLTSHKIILMCVKVTFALILICSTRLFGHACVKKEKLLYGQLDPLQTLKPVIINVLVSLEFVEFNSVHPSYLCPITYLFPDVI